MSSDSTRIVGFVEARDILFRDFERALHGKIKTCMRCDYFNQVKETCGLTSPPQRPPAKIIAYGCPAFSDEVPF